MPKICLGGKEYSYIVSRNRMRSIRFYVDSNHIIQVRAPYFSLKWDIEKALKDNEAWLLDQFSDRIMSLVENLESTYLLGKKYSIIWRLSACNQMSIEGDVVFIDTTSLDPQVQLSHLIAHKKKILQEYVIRYTPYCEQCSKIQGVRYTYRQMKSRFGSCTPSKKHISLNVQLASLDSRAILHVMLHEYAHFLYPNHSKPFHQTLKEWDEHEKWSNVYLRNVRMR